MGLRSLGLGSPLGLRMGSEIGTLCALGVGLLLGAEIGMVRTGLGLGLGSGLSGPLGDLAVRAGFRPFISPRIILQSATRGSSLTSSPSIPV